MTKPKPCSSGASAETAVAESFIAYEGLRNGPVRKSKMGKWRATVLILVHVAIFAHILHWKLAGRTLTPLEPSEAMYTLVNGAVNAGAIVMAGSLLLTLVLGRFFCGWACHMVAMQDLCAWMLKKCGLRPRPLRSRFMMLVPLAAGLYMFFWPVLWMALDGQWPPAFHNGFMETEFWDTFPGFWMGVLTYVVCGFGMVWVLGSKGFCTYACPYGGLFGVVDRYAFGRILVSDACSGCGHCSAVCTSNVIVHQEVRDFGKVVDPGCMKCLDCVSVCPENALRFGFSLPAVFTRARRPQPARTVWSFSLREDLALALLFVLAMLVFRGMPDNIFPEAGNLYGQVPLLLGIGLSALTAFVLLLLARLLRRKDVALFGQELKRAGKYRGAGAAWLLFFAFVTAGFLHSAVLQVAMLRGQVAVTHTASLAPYLWSGDREKLDGAKAWSEDDARMGRSCFRFAQRFGFFADDRIEQQIAWFDALEGDYPTAVTRMKRLLAVHPERHRLRFDMARLLSMQGELLEAQATYMAAVRGAPDDLFMRSALPPLADDLFRGGFVRQAADVLQLACELDPHAAALHSALAEATTTDGRPEDALKVLDGFFATHEPDVHLRVQHAQVQESCGRREAGLTELAALHENVAGDARAAFWSAVMFGRSGREAEADAWWALGRLRDPKLPEWRPVANR
ncbi:MAG: tetratricopeptide repeat protein [Planctomycetes bacterium]|nr:tetratricopeptide repeat protein [Planctomycetota bacterium]